MSAKWIAPIIEKFPQLRAVPGMDPGSFYVSFAHIGDVVLSLRPNFISDGKLFGLPSTTYVGARLQTRRSNAFNEDNPTEPVKPQKGDEQLWGNAWPEVKWEKFNDARASTQIGTFFPGEVKHHPKLLLDQLDGQKLAHNMAEYLLSIVAHDALVIPGEDMPNFLQEVFKPVLGEVYKQLEKQLDKGTDVAMDAAAEVGGKFSSQIELVKKLKDKIKAAGKPDFSEEVEDIDDTMDDASDDDDAMLDNDE